MEVTGGANLLDPIGSRKSFINHVFSTTEEGKAEIFNVLQYTILGVIPIVVLNKFLQRFIPDADSDKSSLEIFVEVLLQLVIMFVGIVVIHRAITYIPTYSEFKYESLTLTNVILGFLVLVLSIQTKLGIKVNILADRVFELWNGSTTDNAPVKKKQQQSDYSESNSQQQSVIFPPTAMSTNKTEGSGQDVLRGNPFNNNNNSRIGISDTGIEPMAANAFGSPFGGF
jgi:hypothetical protein